MSNFVKLNLPDVAPGANHDVIDYLVGDQKQSLSLSIHGLGEGVDPNVLNSLLISHLSDSSRTIRSDDLFKAIDKLREAAIYLQSHKAVVAQFYENQQVQGQSEQQTIPVEEIKPENTTDHHPV